MITDPFTPSFFRRLQQLKIRTRRAFLGARQGGHRSLRKGHGLEFADFRAYAPGDDYRHIDWGVFGRTDRIYVREFREEQDLNVSVILDASASMAYPEGENKFEMAKYLALSLGYVALTDGDSVVFSILGQNNTVRFVGSRSLSGARKELEKVVPKGRFELLHEVRAAISKQRIPGKCFFVSDFFYPLEEIYPMLDHLRARNFEVCLIQILAPSELKLRADSSEVFIDSETEEVLELSIDGSSAKDYAPELGRHIEALEYYANRTGMNYLLLSSAESVSDAVLSKFPEAGILK